MLLLADNEELNYLSYTDQQKSLKQIRDTWFIHNQFLESIGAGKYAMAEYEKVKRFSFPINSNFFCILQESNVDPGVFVENILKIKEAYEN